MGKLKIFTSYFAKYRGGRGISIARFTPKWWKGDCLIDLSPDIETLSEWNEAEAMVKDGVITIDIDNFMLESEEIYTHQYLETLESKEAQEAISKLKDGDVLLCFEKSGRFCHRHILADYLRKLGYKVEEL